VDVQGKKVQEIRGLEEKTLRDRGLLIRKKKVAPSLGRMPRTEGRINGGTSLRSSLRKKAPFGSWKGPANFNGKIGDIDRRVSILPNDQA